jgi:glyoxylase-like metal-dependent hydrolase (beta-lactamase superfamily II)/8-oxo-dGTP pyrophosphatase MutT (NUDIX family)
MKPDAPAKSPTVAVTPRPSATLVLVRDAAAGGLEVLMLMRADRGDQNSLRWVFPGGLVDASDRDVHAHVHALDDASASARLGLSAGGLDYWVATLRETLEEAGLLLALDAHGHAVNASAHRLTLRAWREQSRQSARGDGGAVFAELLSRQGWRLPVDALHPIAHWITPEGLPKRFDTFFFLAVLPHGVDVEVDGVEITEHRWSAPSSLLADPSLRESVRGPTRALLEALVPHADSAAALAWARSIGPLQTVRPRLALDARGRAAPVPPWHPAFSEVARIDPHRHGTAYGVIRPGHPVALMPGRLLRLTANNGSTMTGPGTNTYLLRGAGDDWVVVDPGPDDAAHEEALQRLLASLSARVAAILVTHTHRDHSPAAHALRRATGAPLWGRVADHPQWQDPQFVPQRVLDHGECLDFGGGCVLQVIHTPGHASNHLCFLDEAARLLFTGDHVMQGSTVVINPPDGDMRIYRASLERIARDAGRRYDAIAPGHGFLIEQPGEALARLIAHRRRRGERVGEALDALQDASLEELLLRVYDDTPVERHGVAQRSLLAHLIELQQSGRAVEHDGRWCPAQTS